MCHNRSVTNRLEVAPEIARFVKSYPLVGHAVDFDVRMLQAQGMRFPQRAYDTLELATDETFTTIEATDALGGTERVEFRWSTTDWAGSEAAADVPSEFATANAAQ